MQIRKLEDSDVEFVTPALGLARLYQGDGHYLVAWREKSPWVMSTLPCLTHPNCRTSPYDRPIDDKALRPPSPRRPRRKHATLGLAGCA